MPADAHGLVILPHGIEDVECLSHAEALTLAQGFYQHGLASLLVDLFSSEERNLDAGTGYFQRNTSIMEQRITGIAEWFLAREETEHLSIGYFGIGVSGAAALIAAAERPDIPAAVLAVGAPLELARDYLPRILAPTLLLAWQNDTASIKAHQAALEQLSGTKRFEQIQSGGDAIPRLAVEWFDQHLVTVRA